ncbi:MAG TPA: hypothetical protein VHR66_18945 [Gemmataceae bacterium]|jgi:hypothetical protein|nr:hypothetical protein [Gemmataceae bacterium]
MSRIAIAVFLALLPQAANAQFTPPANASGYAPNMYNRNAQPLSPYLNMLRGGNPAVNYFYGVRPGTQPNAYQGIFGAGNGQRQTFFPGADYLTDLLEEPRDATRVNPTGHPAGFNNTLNYFGPTAGQTFARGEQQQSGARRGR